MVIEVAEFVIQPGTQDRFIDAVRGVLPLITTSPGCLGARVSTVLEDLDHVVVMVEWVDLDAHLVGFRESDRYPQWRAAISPFFADSPRVIHLEEIAISPVS
ncbi:MAG: putative quinol monooxygenase [Ferrimicrobium sp.]